MVVHPFNRRTLGHRSREISEIKASLVCRVQSQTSRAAQRGKKKKKKLYCKMDLRPNTSWILLRCQHSQHLSHLPVGDTSSTRVSQSELAGKGYVPNLDQVPTV